MKRFFSAVLAVAAAYGPAASFAADPSWNSGSYNPTSYVSAAYDWNGFYAGVNAGYSWGESAVSVDGDPIDGVDLNLGGFNGGAQAGFNMNMGGFVIGAETDIQASAVSATYSNGFDEYTSKVNYFGTFRGRVGVPLEGVMPYVTAGVAYGGVTNTLDPENGPTTTDSQFHTGYTLGGGVEVAVSDAMTVKGEYLFTSLGTQTYELDPAIDNDISFHAVRIGVNFGF